MPWDHCFPILIQAKETVRGNNNHIDAYEVVTAFGNDALKIIIVGTRLKMISWQVVEQTQCGFPSSHRLAKHVQPGSLSAVNKPSHHLRSISDGEPMEWILPRLPWLNVWDECVLGFILEEARSDCFIGVGFPSFPWVEVKSPEGTKSHHGRSAVHNQTCDSFLQHSLVW